MSWRAASVVLAALVLGSVPAYAQDAPPPEPAPAAEAAPAASPEVFGPEPPPQEMGPFPEDAVPPEGEGEAPSEAASDPTFDRLFGDPPEAEDAPQVGPPRIKAPELPVWLWGILGLMLVALFVSRRSMLPKRGKDAGIDVRSRATLGKDGNLAVVEVGDGEGGQRRLLIGYGTGAPRLVADLTPIPDLAAYSEPLAEAAGDRDVSPQTPAASPPAASPGPPDRTSRRWEDALERADEEATTRQAPVRPRRGVALERRGDLIAEVLAERTRRQVEVGGDLEVQADDESAVDEKSAGGTTYTFRGRRG